MNIIAACEGKNDEVDGSTTFIDEAEECEIMEVSDPVVFDINLDWIDDVACCNFNNAD